MSGPHISKLMMIAGFSTVVCTFWGAVHYVPPFYTHTYAFAWYGLILFLDGLLWWRWNEGLVVKRPHDFVALLFWSAHFWFIFEIWNLHIQNWYFVGVPPQRTWSRVEAYLDFATVLPGLFLVYRLLCRLRIAGKMRTEFRLRGRTRSVLPWIGLAMFALPVLYPDYFFPLVWGAFVFLLEPLCRKWGGRSLLKDAETGKWTTVVRLLIAGILCGGYWELCNYWSLEKWIYTVPFLSEGKLFEMPYLGFLGFAPFSVECFVMTNAVFLLRGGQHWDPEAPRIERDGATFQKYAYCLMIVLAILLNEWAFARMQQHTIDSHSESLCDILKDVSPSDAKRLTERGWRYPKEMLENWDDAKADISPQFSGAIHQRLELVSLLNMGSSNARLLEAAGVHSPESLAAQSAEELYPTLAKINQTLALRETPLLKRRMVAWIHAAKRESLFY